MKKINGRYHVQTTFNERDYQMLRRMAYEREVTVNELLRVLVRESMSKKEVRKE